MNFDIRQAQLADLPYVYHICLNTADSGQDASELLSDAFIVGQYFAAPYLIHEIETCFVLELDGIPVGYILGALSTEKFNKWMNTNWLPQIRNFYHSGIKPKSDLEKFLIDLINHDCSFPEFLSDYPSHLHIDLLPVAQKKGFGRKMITTLLDALRERGSVGLHLFVGEKNKNAIGFYEKLGFAELHRKDGSVLMGLPVT